MRYELLGPLRVSAGARALSLTAPKVELTLATLLIGAGRSITKTHLIEELWGETPPRRASAAVHVYLSQVRKSLATLGEEHGAAIVTRPSGYVLHLDGAEFDVTEFQHLVRVGRDHQHAQEHEAALEAFERALALQRGPVLDGIAEGPALSAFTRWAEAERLDCLELSVEARTRLGRHREVISLLDGLIGQYPLRESLYRQLMLVLYRAERQAEALGVYHRAQQVLRTELGLDPCRALRRLHRAILTSDRLLDLPLAS